MTATSAASSYDVQVAIDAGFNNVIQNETSGQADSLETGPLTKGTPYQWRVRAHNAGGPGLWATSTFTTTDRAVQRYYLKDHLGLIRAVVDPDAAGTEMEKVVEMNSCAGQPGTTCGMAAACRAG